MGKVPMYASYIRVDATLIKSLRASFTVMYPQNVCRRMYRGDSLMRKAPPPQDPTVGLCVGPYSDPRWGGCFS